MKLNKKNKILIGAFLIMLVLCYKLALENTLKLHHSYGDNLKKKELLSNIPAQLAQLSQKEQYYTKQLSELHIDNSSMQNNLLKFLNLHTAKNKVQIIDFNAPHNYESEEHTINTFAFYLQGNYEGILKTIYALEQQKGFGEISHIQFEKQKNHRTKKTYLQARILLKQIL